MKALIWNNRGIGNAQSVSKLRNLIRKNNLAFIPVIEPKLAPSMAKKYIKRLNMSSYLVNVNERAHIWLFWKQPLDVSLISNSNLHIIVLVSSLLLVNFFVTVVHASYSLMDHRILWDHMMDFSATCDGLWMVGGDFNSILDLAKKKGAGEPFSFPWWISRHVSLQRVLRTLGLQVTGSLGTTGSRRMASGLGLKWFSLIMI